MCKHLIDTKYVWLLASNKQMAYSVMQNVLQIILTIHEIQRSDLPSSSMIVTSAIGEGRSGGRGMTRLVAVNVTIKTSLFSGLLSSLMSTSPQAVFWSPRKIIFPRPGRKSSSSARGLTQLNNLYTCAADYPNSPSAGFGTPASSSASKITLISP